MPTTPPSVDRPDVPPWVRRLLAAAAALVPDGRRADWRREWEAELWYYERRLRAERSGTRAGLGLAWRLGGALAHAAWLRQRLWRSDMMGQDARQAFRMMAARPALTAVVLVTIALGVGANTAMFSVVHAALLRPLPFKDPDRLVVVWPERRGALSRPEYRDVRDESRSFDDLAAANGRSSFSLTGAGDAARLTGVYASVNFFSLFGAQAALGRTFLPDEDQPGKDAVVVLSHGLWQRQFGGDPSIVGRAITLYGISRTVVGVMPASFAMPSAGIELWVPLPLYEHAPGPSWYARYLTLFGRLKPGVTLAQAGEELKPRAAAIKARWPNEDPADIVDRGTVAPLREVMVGNTRPTLAALAGATALLLLVACANIANLLLARGVARQRELAVRAALGAGRARLARQLIVESVVLALAGGAAGVAAAVWSVRALVPLLPVPLGPFGGAQVNGPVLAFAFGLALATGVVAGLAPAWRIARTDLSHSLREARSPASSDARRLQRVFTVAQVALATLLLVGAGLLLRSLWRLQQVDPGFNPERVLAVQITPPPGPYDEEARRVALYDELLRGIGRLPSVVAAGAIQHLPLAGSHWTVPVFPEGQEFPDGVEPRSARYRVVTPGYFSTMGVRLVKGRLFADGDRRGQPQAAVVSDALAAELWPGEAPIGKRLRTIIGPREWIEVVGVVAGVHAEGLGEAAVGELYRPYAQDPQAAMALVIRTTGEPTAVAADARAIVRRADADVAVSDIRPMMDIVAASVARPRATALLLLVFAALALVLGVVGVHGVVAYAVSQRSHEFGVRMAIGACAGDVRRLVVGDAARLVGVGLMLGLGAALAGGRAMTSLLFEVRPADPLTLLGVAVVLGAAGLVAAWLPARRATRVDPLVVLRAE